MDTDLRDAYLRRLGVDEEPPSVEGLARLHRAHVEQVSYENLWIHLGDRWPVTAAVSVARIAASRRGGYCYHLNGAFAELLRGLGYEVSRHIGGVHGPEGAGEAAMSNHLVLTVQGLPSDDHPAGTWYVDVGLGDALHEPLPLRSGAYDQGPFHLVLSETPGGIGDWHLTHDPAGGFAGMAWRSAPVEMDAFAVRHDWLSTSPESGFVRVLTVQRRDATGADVLKGLTLKRVGDGASEHMLAARSELVDVLGDLFALDVAAVRPAAWDDLWRGLHAAHEEWVAAGRPS